jgi:hypothetical protein
MKVRTSPNQTNREGKNEEGEIYQKIFRKKGGVGRFRWFDKYRK